MANTTPVTTVSGEPAFPTDPSAPGATTPTAVPGSTTPGGMPTYVPSGGGGGSSKTTFGFPTAGNQPIDITTGPDSFAKIPNYVKGDEFAPGHDPDPDNVRDIQTRLVNSGLLKLSDVHLGLWDAASANAYAKVLGYANSQGLPANVALDAYVKTSTQLPAKTIDPNDLKAMANQVATSVLGINLNDDQLQRFSVAFNAAMNGPTGGPTSDAGRGQLASDLLTKEQPYQAQEQRIRNVGQEIMSIIDNLHSGKAGA